MKFKMVNVVCYDGCDAWVSKFVMPVSRDGKRKFNDLLLSYDGEVLKIDELYEMSFENVLALQNADTNEMKCCWERFCIMMNM